MQTLKNVGPRIMNKLFNNMFDSATKEYLSFLGLECTENGTYFPPSSDSLIRKMALQTYDFNAKVENTKNLADLLKKDEYTGTVIHFEKLLKHVTHDSTSRITFLNKETVHYHGNDTLNIAEHQKINDIDIIRFKNGHILYTLFIKPQESIICYAVLTDPQRTDRYILIEKFVGKENKEELVWVENGLAKLAVTFDMHANGFCVYTNDNTKGGEQFANFQKCLWANNSRTV